MAKSTTIREICPRCNGNAFVTTPKNGLSFCFLCRYWERDGTTPVQPKVRSEYIEQIRDLYNQAAHYYHASLTKEARIFLHQRGISDETIQRFLIGFAPAGRHPMYKTPIAVEAGIGMPHDSTGVLAGRITFPYFFNKDIITDIRGRSITADEEIKYKSLYNNSYYRGADYLYNHHLSHEQTVLICEGEIKALLACQHGYAALAMPGINSLKQFRERDDQKAIIVFDSQVKNQKFVNQAIIKLASTLTNAYVAVLPLLGKDKQDVDGFIIEYGIDMFRSIIDNALPFQEWRILVERF